MQLTVKRLRKIAIGFMQVQILPAVFLCAATSLIVLGSTATLIVTAPFMPDTEEEGLKKVALQFSVPLLGGAVWLLGAMVVLTQLQNWELEDELEQAEQRYNKRLREIETQRQQAQPEPDTSCDRCKYWSDIYSVRPCAVHPMGRPGEKCLDWELDDELP